MSSNNFIPRADAAFNRFFRRLCDVVEEKTGEPQAELAFIPSVEVAELITANVVWTEAYEVMAGPHTGVDTATKNTTRAAGEKVIRRFKKRNIDARDEVSDATRLSMGFPVWDTVLTRANVPDIYPFIMVQHTRSSRQHRVIAINPLSDSVRKPVGTWKLCFACQVGGERPATAEAIADKRSQAGVARLYTFGEDKAGLPVYYAVCYENSRGDRGPWSSITVVYVD